jgi:hypothetical protein
MRISAEAIRQTRRSCLSVKTCDRSRERIMDRLSKRITHNSNELSQDEKNLHVCMVVEDLLRKNPDIRINLSKHQGLREALESKEVRRKLVKIDSIFVGSFGYNWELATSTFIPHPLSIVPINSEFHNAELAHIAIKSHRRSAYDLQRARGKQRPILIIFTRFNHPRIFSGSFFNPTTKLIGIQDVTKPKGSIIVMSSNTHNDVGAMGSRTQHSRQHIGNLVVTDEYEAVKKSTLSTSKVDNNMFDKKYLKENCPKKIVDVDVCVWGPSTSNTTHTPTGFYSNYYLGTTVNNSSYSLQNSVRQVPQMIAGHDTQRCLLFLRMELEFESDESTLQKLPPEELLPILRQLMPLLQQQPQSQPSNYDGYRIGVAA